MPFKENLISLRSGFRLISMGTEPIGFSHCKAIPIEVRNSLSIAPHPKPSWNNAQEFNNLKNEL